MRGPIVVPVKCLFGCINKRNHLQVTKRKTGGATWLPQFFFDRLIFTNVSCHVPTDGSFNCTVGRPLVVCNKSLVHFFKSDRGVGQCPTVLIAEGNVQASAFKGFGSMDSGRVLPCPYRFPLPAGATGSWTGFRAMGARSATTAGFTRTKRICPHRQILFVVAISSFSHGW